MVTIRLMRTGKKSRPTYRIVAQDSRSKLNGGCLETLGTYDPRRAGGAVTVKRERVDAWRAKGATVSPTVRDLLRRAKRAAG
jgi:small subunit ribosomal protein S16